MTVVLHDGYSVEERELLERRWDAAHRDLDDARRHVEIAAAYLYGRVPADLCAAFFARWAADTFAALDHLDLIGELPKVAA